VQAHLRPLDTEDRRPNATQLLDTEAGWADRQSELLGRLICTQ